VPESRTVRSLSEPQRQYLALLRQEPAFREAILALGRTQLRPWSPAKPPDPSRFVYESGMMQGEQNIIDALLHENLAVPLI